MNLSIFLQGRWFPHCWSGITFLSQNFLMATANIRCHFRQLYFQEEYLLQNLKEVMFLSSESQLILMLITLKG